MAQLPPYPLLDAQCRLLLAAPAGKEQTLAGSPCLLPCRLRSLAPLRVRGPSGELGLLVATSIASIVTAIVAATAIGPLDGVGRIVCADPCVASVHRV